jgi:hypothetical protein
MIFASTASLDANGHLIHRAILRNDIGKVVFDLCVTADTIPAWLDGFVGWARTVGPGKTDDLRACATHLDQCRFWPTSKPTPTFWRVAFALAQFFDEEPMAVDTNGEDGAHGLLTTWLERNFSLSAHTYYEQGRQSYRYWVRVGGKTLLQSEQPLDVLSDGRVQGSFVRAEWWMAALHRESTCTRTEKAQALLEHYDILQQALHRQARITPDQSRILHQSLAELAKALISYLDQSDELALLRNHIPDLTVSIVQNPYDSSEAQKLYLDRLLSLPETPEHKRQRLRMLAASLEHMPSRLKSVAGPVSAYYLNQYNLNEAAYFWKPLADQHRLLKLILMLYQQPGRFALAALFYFAFIWGFVFLQQHTTGIPHAQCIISAILAVWLIAVLLPVCGGLIYIATRFLARHGVDYIELLLPRLFGAIVVGLSVLLLQDTAWQMGLQLSWANWILLCVIVYALSFLYIYIDIYKTVRLIPMAESPVERTLYASGQIYVISLLEAFLVTLISTALCAHAVLDSNLLSQGATAILPGVGRLDIFPRLILLWTGLALFIGAFVQLIWQDRQITSPL